MASQPLAVHAIANLHALVNDFDMNKETRREASSERRGAIGVIVRDDGRLLVIERSQAVRAPGRFCFPGGGIEPGESEEDAVRRELSEELDIYVIPIRRLWQSRTKSRVLLHWWLVRPLDHQQPTPNPTEVARYFWMTPQEISSRRETLLSNREFIAALEAGVFSLVH